jgi:hypothetical protein
LSWQKIVGGDGDELEKLSEIASCRSADVSRFALKSFPGHKKFIGHEPIQFGLLTFVRLKVCPLCVQDWITQEGQLKQGPPVFWQLSPVQCCHLHHVPLSFLPPSEYPRSSHDVAGRIFDHLPELRSAASQTSLKVCNSLETYLVERIRSGPKGVKRWPDKLEIGLISKTCTKLSEVSQVLHEAGGYQCNRLSESDVFDAMNGGELTFKELLREIWLCAPSEKGGFFADFGRYAFWVAKVAEQPGANPLLDAVRDFIELHYPVGTGEKVLGRVCTSRKIHSVITASQKYGIQRLRLLKLFRSISKAGGYKNLPMPDARNQVRHEAYDDWLRLYSETINPKIAAQKLGVSYDLFCQLKRTGWLQPFFSSEDMIDRYHPADLQRALDSIFLAAKPIEQPSEGRVAFLSAPIHCRCSCADVLQLVRAGKLKSLLRLRKGTGLASLFVSKQEVLDALEGQPINGFTKDQLRRRWRTNPSTIAYLIGTKAVLAERVKHPRNRKWMDIVRQGEVKRFEKNYRTLGCLSAEMNEHPIKVAAQLAQDDIKPLEMPEGLSRIYRAAELSRTR